MAVGYAMFALLKVYRIVQGPTWIVKLSQNPALLTDGKVFCIPSMPNLRVCRGKLLQFGFWRVVLDEAQLVAQTNSVAALACSSLWRRHAWVVSGTPITSRVQEIQASHIWGSVQGLL
jgi:SNF2 family DNA or RNA helicase